MFDSSTPVSWLPQKLSIKAYIFVHFLKSLFENSLEVFNYFYIPVNYTRSVFLGGRDFTFVFSFFPMSCTVRHTKVSKHVSLVHFFPLMPVNLEPFFFSSLTEEGGGRAWECGFWIRAWCCFPPKAGVTWSPLCPEDML